jgi:hypothetical protein
MLIDRILESKKKKRIEEEKQMEAAKEKQIEAEKEKPTEAVVDEVDDDEVDEQLILQEEENEEQDLIKTARLPFLIKL